MSKKKSKRPNKPHATGATATLDPSRKSAQNSKAAAPAREIKQLNTRFVVRFGLFLLSFTQGDVSLYGNWWERASQDGLAATAQMYDETMVQQGYMGMIAISIGLIFASALLWKLMDTRWGRSEFSN